MQRRLALAAAALIAAGCHSNPLAPSDFVGSTWQLVSFQDGMTVPLSVADPTRYTALFGSDGRVSVKSDCNACAGEYSLSGAVFRVGPLACTRAFCGATSLDPAFPAAIDKARSLTMDVAAELTIHGDAVTLRFKR